MLFPIYSDVVVIIGDMMGAMMYHIDDIYIHVAVVLLKFIA